LFSAYQGEAHHVSVIEVARLHVADGQGDAFEQAFARAHPYLAAASGHRHSELVRATEAADVYLLLVHWRAIEDHVTQFVGSEDFQAFRSLLWPYFSLEPQVEHFATVELGR
jgi:heme-degrading monooxygenase HmoA